MAKLTNPQKALMKALAGTGAGTGNKRVEIRKGELRTAQALERQAFLTIHCINVTHGNTSYGKPFYEASLTAAGWARVTTLANEPPKK
jgi:hypothetical protein